MARNIKAASAMLVITLALVGPWKAVLLLFVTSDDFPLGHMAGAFPERFLSKQACLEFATKRMGEIGKDIDMFIAGDTRSFKVLNHEIICIEGGRGRRA